MRKPSYLQKGASYDLDIVIITPIHPLVIPFHILNNGSLLSAIGLGGLGAVPVEAGSDFFTSVKELVNFLVFSGFPDNPNPATPSLNHSPLLPAPSSSY